MPLPYLRLWEEAALKPAQTPPDGEARQRRAPRTPEPAAPDLRKARLSRTRLQIACLQGLFFCVLLGTPLGWSYVRTTWLATDPGLMGDCPELASLLSPEIQRNLQARRSSGGISTSDRKVLGTKVCDPALRALLQPVLGGVSDLSELRGLAERSGALDAKLQPRPALRAFLGGPASD